MDFSLPTESYATQAARWADEDRHILAHYDEETIVVYQAYRPSIGHHAITHQRFGGDFSMSRMTWIKPNFMWMMYRCGWAQKEGQEVVLAVHLRREAFDRYLRDAVHSRFMPERYSSAEAWQERTRHSSVRLQWDPDHGPTGEKKVRRAIQIGLRGETVKRYVNEDIVRIEDATPFVEAQRVHVGDLQRLRTPSERVYPVSDPDVASHLGID